MAAEFGLVCEKCLEADPSRIELFTRKCFQESLHAGKEPIVKVVRTARNRCLERWRSDASGTGDTQPIRPMPRVWFRGEFVLCIRGKHCKGQECTYPHSTEERDAWNAEKFGRSRVAISQSHSPKFEGITGPEWPTLHSAYTMGALTWSPSSAAAWPPPSPAAWPPPSPAAWPPPLPAARPPPSPAARPPPSPAAWPPPSPAAWPPPSAAAWPQQMQSTPRSTGLQQPSRPLLTHTQPAKDFGSSTPLPEGPSHQIGALRKRYPSDPSDLILPSWMSSQPRLKHQPQSQTEPPTSTVDPEIQPAELEIQPAELETQPAELETQPPELEIQPPELEIQTLEPGSRLNELDTQSAEPMILPVAEEIPSFMRLSLAALLSEFPLPQPDPSPWPTLSELGAKLYLSPVPSPSVAQAPLIGMHVSTTPPIGLPLPQAACLPQINQQPAVVASTTISTGDSKPPRHNYAAKATKFLARIRDDLLIEDIQVELTQANYKEKFHKLLCWEEKAHIEVLGEKCNGWYTLVLHQAGLKKPPWMLKESKPFHKRFGYLLGLNGDQIAYATQASEGAIIEYEGTEIKLDLLMENYNHVEERLYVALDRRNLEKLEKLNTISVSNAPFRSHMKLEVQFELKHSYFNNLHAAVECLSPAIIARIIPNLQKFVPNPSSQILVPDLQQYGQYCSEDQLNALQAIATCPSNGPPVVIAGAFGTGKSRVLAIAAHYFFRRGKSKQPARVLVCTQQRTSADTFLDCYLNLMDTQGEEVYLIRSSYGFSNPRLKRWYRSVSDFRSYIERSSYRNRSKFLIITTCMTALQLARIIPREFFTHILLDEGAQMREPEAVAAFSMAGRNTKIVIAGDQNQVGPAMLVLGDEAQKNGLAESLLERLHRLYGKLGEAAAGHCASLVTNYRCHGGILRLAEKLFYDLPLQCKVPPGIAHPAAHYPLQFCCSSIDDQIQLVDSTINEHEATIVLKLIAELAKQWPNASWGPLDSSQMCIMSPSRSQLTVANQLIRELRLYKLQQLRRLPTYNVQGHEFRALFLSTSEPTDKDGATRNPTKSICDRYVFNTAITRAQSLVVAVGNPFILLWMERHMVQKYSEKGKCWSNYLKFCLDHDTLTIHDSLHVPEAEKKRCIQKLQKLVENQLLPSSGDTQCSEAAAVASPQQPQRTPTPIVPSEQMEISRSGTAMEVSLQIRTSLSETSLLTDDTESKPLIVPAKEEASSYLKDPGLHSCRLEMEYKVMENLGEGGFGVVFRVKNELDDTEYAVKIIELPKKKDRVVREVRALAKLNHPNIVRYYTSWVEDAPPDWRKKKLWKALRSSESSPCADRPPCPSDTVSDASASSVPAVSSSTTTPSHSMVRSDVSVGAQQAGSSDSFTVEFQNDTDTTQQTSTDDLHGTFNPLPRSLTCLYIQTELCQKKTLKDWLQDNIETRKRQTVINFFTQVLEAVVFIHQKGYLHRDLKPSNIFFSLEDDSVKVGDFGLATGTSAPSSQRNGSGRQSHSKDVGTRLYMSPEQKAGGKYDEKVDMYALGVILFELNCPFRTTSEKSDVVGQLQDEDIFPSKYEDQLPVEAAMVRSLLDKQPSSRPSAEEVYNGAQLKGLRKALKKSKKSPFVPIV